MISIIIPVYNGANYMREAIDSALAQTYPNVEIIVVNDGSTDHSEEIALSYGDRLRYFAKENGGVSTALNLGIEKMRGDYFSWLSHDDLYAPNKLEVQMEALRAQGKLDAIVYSDYTELNMADRTVEGSNTSNQFEKVQLENSLFPVCFGLIHGCSLLIHRSHFERVGLFKEELRTTQDYDLWFRMFRGQRLIFVPQPLICCRLHPEQGTHTIACHQAEREQLFAEFFLSLSEEEIEALFGHPAMLYGRVKTFVCTNGLSGLERSAMERYASLKISESARHRAEKFCGHIKEMCKNLENICIFGCGVYGKWLHTFLDELGVFVRFFSDNNPKLWGQKVDGCICISPEQLRQIQEKTLIVAAVQKPNYILTQLRELGCVYITTKQELDKLFFETV